MKKILAIVMGVLLHCSLSAQKITHADLIGKWELVLVNNNGAVADFENKKVSFSEKKKESMTPEELQAEERMMMEVMETMGITMVFIDEETVRFSLSLPGSVETTGYTLEERDGKQFIVNKLMPTATIQALPGLLELRQPGRNGLFIAQFKKKM